MRECRCRKAVGLPMLRRTASRFVSSPALFSTTLPCLGREQLDENRPTSTARKPRGPHRGRHKRGVSEKEKLEWDHMRKFELLASDEWDDLEKFRSLPKPKKLLGNEACHVVWPYATLLEKTVKVHPLTKSIYVYYPQHSLTSAGEYLRLATRQFSWEWLVPIAFHCNQCYVETELLVEYSDNPWVVVNCIDGRSEIITVTQEVVGPAREDGLVSEGQLADGSQQLLQRVVEVTDKLAASAQMTPQLVRELHDRPLQNQFIRIDYQWFGETPEDRAQHMVQWTHDDAGAQPTVAKRHVAAFQWANVSGYAPVSPAVRENYRKEKSRMFGARKNKGGLDVTSFMLSQRNMANFARAVGYGPKE